MPKNEKRVDMLKRIFLAMGLVISLTGPVWAEAPVGDWQAVGHNAGDQREYRGNVSVVKSGDTYTVLWRFGATTYIGTGLELGTHFAVTFKPTETPIVGLLLLQKQGDHWTGKWTQMGAKTAGGETWRKFGLNTPDK